jgi:predicted RNA-binding Zn-ribbon protein involved in translation (DUF1610 family)
MKILALDIETKPNLAHVWGLWDQNVSIGQLKEVTEMLCFGARWVGETKITFRSKYHDGKQAMLDEAWNLLDECDALMTWNGKSFDSKHLKREFIQAGMNPPSPYKELDLMLAVKSQFKFPSNKLDYVSQALGVGQKVKHKGFDLWLDVIGENGTAAEASGWKAMKEYQLQDVNLLIDLYEKLLPWIPNHPNVALYDDVPFGCPHCGSDKLQKRGEARLSAGTYQRYLCLNCGSWPRGSKRLDTTELRNTAS